MNVHLNGHGPYLQDDYINAVPIRSFIFKCKLISATEYFTLDTIIHITMMKNKSSVSKPNKLVKK